MQATRCALFAMLAAPVTPPTTGGPPAATAPPSAAPPMDVEPPASPKKTDTTGPALGVGLGTQFVAIGAQLSYYIQIPRTRLRVTPWAAFGETLWFPEEGDPYGVPATSAGAFASYGRNHRVLFGVFYGPGGSTTLSLHGEEPEVRLEWGPGMAAGWEYMHDGGFFLRADLGVQLIVTMPILATADRIVPALTLVGVGYKLW